MGTVGLLFALVWFGFTEEITWGYGILSRKQARVYSALFHSQLFTGENLRGRLVPKNFHLEIFVFLDTYMKY